MANNFVNKIRVPETVGSENYIDHFIGVDAEHVEIDEKGTTLKQKIIELENATPDIATRNSAGIVKPGEGLEIEADGTLKVNKATSSNLGLVKPGQGIEIETDGTLKVNNATSSSVGLVKPGTGLSVNDEGSIEVNKATSSSIGMVKPGAGLSINDEGTIEVKNATSSTTGLVKPGEGLSIDGDGILKVNKATSSTPGLVQPGTGLSVDENGILEVLPSGSNRTLTFKDANGNTINTYNGDTDITIENIVPVNHASANSQYGIGNASNYGHLKISNQWRSNPGDTTSVAGVAASLDGVREMYRQIGTDIKAALNYPDLKNKPTINNVPINGALNLEDLGISFSDFYNPNSNSGLTSTGVDDVLNKKFVYQDDEPFINLYDGMVWIGELPLIVKPDPEPEPPQEEPEEPIPGPDENPEGGEGQEPSEPESPSDEENKDNETSEENTDNPSTED